MSYDTQERSSTRSRPFSLFEFKLGTTRWLYVRGEQEVVISGGPAAGRYLPLNIKEDGIKQTGSPDNDEMYIELPKTAPVAQLFAGVAPSERVIVICRRGNYGSDDAPVYWVGSVKSRSQPTLNSAKLLCQVAAASFKRPGIRLAWGRSCPHALYDNLCRVKPSDWVFGFTVEAISGIAVFSAAVAALPPGRFIGGYVEWTTAFGSIERRAIENQRDNAMQILEGTQDMTVGMFVKSYPGCPRTIAGCKSFNNLPNYGGFPHLPGRSPFDGDPVF